MAINTSTATGISQRTNVYAERRMLRYAGPHLVLEKFGLAKELPKNSSSTIRFRRPVTFAAKTTPLVEGVTPTGTKFSYEDVSATLRQYGDVIYVTDVIQDTHEDPVLRDITQQAGDNIGRTVEQLNFAVVKAGTNVIYAGGATQRSDVVGKLRKEELRSAIRTLKRNKALPFTEMIGPGPNYGTQAVEPCYVVVIHVDLENDLRQIPGFVPCTQYGRATAKVHEREIGAIEEMRFVCSADLDPWTGAGGATTDMVNTSGQADVYPVLVFGKEAWGHVALRGGPSYSAVNPHVHRPTHSPSDPMAQRGFVSWKFYHAAVRLNEAWMIRIEVAATDI
ncbi:MAG: N4-gp56 family major capsid protein [Pseudomonadota bacterium]